VFQICIIVGNDVILAHFQQIDRRRFSS